MIMDEQQKDAASICLQAMAKCGEGWIQSIVMLTRYMHHSTRVPNGSTNQRIHPSCSSAFPMADIAR